jgi:hypothetical protein
MLQLRCLKMFEQSLERCWNFNSASSYSPDERSDIRAFHLPRMSLALMRATHLHDDAQAFRRAGDAGVEPARAML